MIQTYVILDLETSGLSKFNFGFTKITEISLVAVSVKHFIDCSPGSIPRVLNRFTKCYHPQRFIGEKTENISGLSNELLEEQKTLNLEECELIIKFILSLPQPVCLLAHYGYDHDFPLLQAHTKVHGKPLPDSILCSDTLLAFRELQVLENLLRPWGFPADLLELYPAQLKEQDEYIESASEIYQLMNQLEEDFVNRLEEGVMTRIKEDLIQIELKDVMEMNKAEEKKNQDNLEFLHQKTPTRPILSQNSTPCKWSSNPGRRSPQAPSTSRDSVRKQLFKTTTKIADLKPSYRLPFIYNHLFHEKIPNVHSAEGDTMALLKCLTAVGPVRINEWVCKNNKKLSSIKKSW